MPDQFDATLGWHEAVHRRLGEVLYYFFVKVNLNNPNRIKAQFDRLIADKKLSSVRIFEVFGTYDLIIRAWVHSSKAQEFRKWIQDALGEECRLIHLFEVTHVDHRWYPALADRSLSQVTEELIKRAQRDNRDLQRLVDIGLITQRPMIESGPRLIRFFVTVYFEMAGLNLYLDDGERISTEIAREISTNMRSLEFVTVDRGLGLCSMLIKGETIDYFSIAALPKWISTQYKLLRARTETYLVHTSRHLVGHEMIGEMTFVAMRGKDFFAYSIVPELYDGGPVGRNHETVLNFLRQLGGRSHEGLELTEKDKLLLRAYVLAFLNENTSEMGKVLYGLFAGLEHYLRATHKPLLGRLGVYEATMRRSAIESSKKHLALGDLLTLISVGSTEARRPEFSWPEWNSLVELRNKLMHGAFEDLDFSDLSGPLAELMARLPGLRKLLGAIEQVTGIPYEGD